MLISNVGDSKCSQADCMHLSYPWQEQPFGSKLPPKKSAFKLQSIGYKRLIRPEHPMTRTSSHKELAGTLLSACRCCSQAFSGAVKKAALAGDSARLTLVYKPIRIVGIPSTMKSHCQPAKPSRPSSANRPAASGAPMTYIPHTRTWEPLPQVSLAVQSAGKFQAVLRGPLSMHWGVFTQNQI